MPAPRVDPIADLICALQLECSVLTRRAYLGWGRLSRDSADRLSQITDRLVDYAYRKGGEQQEGTRETSARL